jgi:hypothetical protein
MTDTQQTFTLLDPSGVPIMKGSMNTLMEHLPDTHARNDALSTMLDTAVKQVAAEEQLEQARTIAVKHFCDGITRLATRLDQFEKQRALSAKRAEAARKEPAQRQVQRYMDEQWEDPDAERETSQRDGTELPAPEDPTGVTLKGDDGDLEIKHAVDPERYGPNDDDSVGDLPPELKKGAPAPSGSYTEPEPQGGPKDPRQVQQFPSSSVW